MNNNESETSVNDAYDPKRNKKTKLTISEKMFIAAGSLFFMIMMILIKHPEIYRSNNDHELESEIVTYVSFEQNINARHLNLSKISGYATRDDTINFSKRFPKLIAYGSTVSDLFLSKVGLGTYLGETSDEVDDLMIESIQYGISKGINVIDTAINYRGMNSEKAIGIAINRAINSKLCKREELFISTKAGFIPSDISKSISTQRMAAEWSSLYGPKFPDEQIIDNHHCIHPICLDISIQTSLANLGLQTIDLLYLHNVAEKQPSELLLERLSIAFIHLEKIRQKGLIRYYGLATWSCFRVGLTEEGYLSLDDVMALALKAGGSSHGFRFLQVPLTWSMPEAATARYQRLDRTLLEAAAAMNLAVMTSRSIDLAKYNSLASVYKVYQSCLLTTTSSINSSVTTLDVPPHIHPDDAAADAEADQVLSRAALSLHLTRSIPLITTALVGMRQKSHITENAAVLSLPPLSPALLSCALDPKQRTAGIISEHPPASPKHLRKRRGDSYKRKPKSKHQRVGTD